MTTTEDRPVSLRVRLAQTRRTRRPRKPVRRFLVVSHRWLSLALGLFLLVETTSAIPLLYQGEIHRALSHGAFSPGNGPATVTMEDAREAVAAAHPDFEPTAVIEADGVLNVTDYSTSYTVDPATGAVLGHVGKQPGWLDFLANLHECMLTCEGETGTVGLLSDKVPGTAWLSFEDPAADLTVGNAILVALGVLLLLLSLGGLWLWFPRPSRWRSGFAVRRGKGRFARDTDLHKVIGIAALAPLLMWGLTGAGFEAEPLRTAWYAVLPGSEISADPHPDTLPSAPGTPVDTDQALALAEQAAPGTHAVSTSIPAKDDEAPAYDIWLSSAHDPYGHSEYPGDVEISVDQRTGETTRTYGFPGQSPTQTVWDDWSYPVHSGFVVNGWWRLIWLALALTPLALAVTGVSTWLVRLRSDRARRARKRARLRAT